MEKCLKFKKCHYRYTSIGSKHNTRPNPKLAITDDTGNVSYLPAWLLKEGSSERAGRGSVTNQVNGHNGHRNDELED